MKVFQSISHQASGTALAQEVIDLLANKPHATLGLATGGSVEPVYAHLKQAYQAKQVCFAQATTINLDEYLGLDPHHPQSYHTFMREQLFDGIDLPPAQSYIPAGNAPAEIELQIFRNWLEKYPRDLQILGVGTNGHIAFNEPADTLQAQAHVVDIALETRQANARYFDRMDEVPKQAFTQGMGDILQAKHLCLIASGLAKVAAMRELLSHDRIDTKCPCTFLKAHGQVHVFIDQALADAL